MSATAVDPLVELAIDGLGVACLPSFAMRDEIANGRLVSIPEEWVTESGQFHVLWQAARSRRN